MNQSDEWTQEVSTDESLKKGRELTPWVISRIAGASYLGIILCGIYAEFVVRASLITPENPGATAINLVVSEQLFRTGIAADLMMLAFDAILALALYQLLVPVQRFIAQLAAILRLVHTAVVGSSLISLFAALDVAKLAAEVGGAESVAFTQQTLLSVEAHANGYTLGLIFFGFHCALLGYLLLKSPEVPSVFGVLIIAASLGYLIDGAAQILMVDYSAHADVFATVVVVPAVIGELSFALWLLLRGFGRRSNPERERGS